MDGLRFVAIAWVVLLHAGDSVASHAPTAGAGAWLATLFRAGTAGVPVFFAISGFIIGLPFAEHALAQGPRVSLRAYLLRRLTRLEPPYIINLVLCSILPLLHGAPAPDHLLHLLVSAAYQHNLVFGYWSTINYIAWSLEVEVQFYLLAPLLARIFFWPATGRRFLIVLVMVGVSLVNAFAAPPGPTRYSLCLAAWIHYFLIGFLVADLRVTGAFARLGPRAWSIVGLAAWGALVPIRLGGVAYPLLFPPVVAVAFAATLASPAWRALFSTAWIATIGGMCYTIYLYHPPLMHFANRWVRPALVTSRIGWITAVLALSAFSILASVPFFVLLERPFMFRDWPQRLRNALGRRR